MLMTWIEGHVDSEMGLSITPFWSRVPKVRAIEESGSYRILLKYEGW